jgi:micrococcal nuclease
MLWSRWAAVLLIVLVCSSAQGSPTEFKGKVVGVLDGDTIEALHNHHAEHIRLNGIDCPEKGQAYGKKAKQAASALVFGKEVKLQTHGKDKYGRTIADVFLPDGTNVNYALVKDGWCWWYRKYAPGNVVLEELERGARGAGLGLWADPTPVPPWVYRKARGGKALDLSDVVPLESETEGRATSRGPPLLEPVEQDSVTSSYPIIGNRRSQIYHRPDCPNYSQISPRNRVPFNSAAAAEAAGYRRAGNCP